MLLRQMKYFAAVVECGSFTEAAEQCYISQSAISQQIRTLEKELGVELLHRRNRKFTVTTAGEYFYSQCRAVLAQVEELVQETRRLGTDRDLQLRIGYLRCYSGLELHQAVAEFSKIYPEVSIHIVDGTPGGHLAFGDGTLPLEDFVHTIGEWNYKGYLSMEISDRRYFEHPERADKQSIDLFRQWIQN